MSDTKRRALVRPPGGRYKLDVNLRIETDRQKIASRYSMHHVIYAVAVMPLLLCRCGYCRCRFSLSRRNALIRCPHFQPNQDLE